MTKNFLTGNFLRAYGSSFGKIRSKPEPAPGLTPDELAIRFSERRQKTRARRLRYILALQAGIVAALVLAIGVFHLDFQMDASGGLRLTNQEVVQMEEIIQTQQIERPPPPARPPIPVEVPNDVELSDEELDFDAVLDMDEALADLPPPPAAATDVAEEAEPEIFVAVENPPEMIGGLPALQAVLNYPELARRAALEGRVVVRVIINELGEPSDPEILRSVTDVLDNEAIRAVMLQKFRPGRQRGRPVSVYMAIPVVFQLN